MKIFRRIFICNPNHSFICDIYRALFHQTQNGNATTRNVQKHDVRATCRHEYRNSSYNNSAYTDVCVFDLQNHQAQNIQARIRAVRKFSSICNINGGICQKYFRIGLQRSNHPISIGCANTIYKSNKLILLGELVFLNTNSNNSPTNVCINERGSENEKIKNHFSK